MNIAIAIKTGYNMLLKVEIGWTATMYRSQRVSAFQEDFPMQMHKKAHYTLVTLFLQIYKSYAVKDGVKIVIFFL